jgi:hypothetical protein
MKGLNMNGMESAIITHVTNRLAIAVQTGSAPLSPKILGAVMLAQFQCYAVTEYATKKV